MGTYPVVVHEVALPPGACLSLLCGACRLGAGQPPPFAVLFKDVGPRLQDWVEALRTMVVGSTSAPTLDKEQLSGEMWLFLQVCEDGGARGSPCASGDSATRGALSPSDTFWVRCSLSNYGAGISHSVGGDISPPLVETQSKQGCVSYGSDLTA